MGMTEELRLTAAKLINVGKFAVDSAVNESLKGGMQVYAVVKGKLKGQAQPHPDLSYSHKKPNLVMVEEMRAKLEKMQEDMNDIQQQHKISTLVGTEQPKHHQKRFSQEPIKNSTPEINGQRKIFIRSRL